MLPVVLSRGGGVCLAGLWSPPLSSAVVLSQGCCRAGVSASLQSQARQPGWHPARLALPQLDKMILYLRCWGGWDSRGCTSVRLVRQFWARQPVRLRLVVVGAVGACV